MEYPIKLPPLAVIKAKALAALEAGELQAQRPDFNGTECRYVGPCAIGAALPFETRRHLDGRAACGIGALINDKVVEPADVLDVTGLLRIQRAHDCGNLDDLRRLLST